MNRVTILLRNRIVTPEKPLVETEEHLQTAIHTREAHEGQREQTGGEHDDGHALHAARNLDQFEL